jgi:hypothetical protein
MKFESPARIALPIGLLPNTIIKTRREHLLQWEARVALFNGIIDERASITGHLVKRNSGRYEYAPLRVHALHQLPFPAGDANSLPQHQMRPARLERATYGSGGCVFAR